MVGISFSVDLLIVKGDSKTHMRAANVSPSTLWNMANNRNPCTVQCCCMLTGNWIAIWMRCIMAFRSHVRGTSGNCSWQSYHYHSEEDQCLKKALDAFSTTEPGANRHMFGLEVTLLKRCHYPGTTHTSCLWWQILNILSSTAPFLSPSNKKKLKETVAGIQHPACKSS